MLDGLMSRAAGVVAAVCLVASAAAAQGTWPERPIRLVVPYPPGGISDALARYVGRVIEKDLGQPIVIENKGGAGSNIGSSEVAKSSPDGYTVLLASTANAVNMTLYKKLSYDTQRDLVPVSLIADVPNVLVVNAQVPVKSVAELIALAKQKPDDLAYASAGAGSPAHLAAEIFVRSAGIRIRHVAYRGAGPAITDVIGGHVPIMFTNLAAVLGGIEAGKLRLLGVGGRKRWPAFPDVPTISEAGLPGYEAGAWYGLMVPTGTPQSVVDRLQKALDLVRKPEGFAEITKLGAEPVVSTAAELKARIEAELASYSKLIKEAGITIE